VTCLELREKSPAARIGDNPSSTRRRLGAQRGREVSFAVVRPDLLRWQREGYPEFHRDPVNLWIHIVAVPAFVAALVSLVVALCKMQWIVAGAALVGMVASFALQGVGHKREQTPSVPFDGPSDAFSRIFAEQLVTFPRFLFSGEWLAALRGKPQT
jgi:hypothetical protein